MQLVIEAKQAKESEVKVKLLLQVLHNKDYVKFEEG